MKSNIPIHDFDNNPESQQTLDENRQKFSNQVLLLLQLLNSGVRLTVAGAIGYGINSLPRRIADAKEAGVTNIKDEWVKDGNGKRLYKVWYVEGLRPPTKQEVTENAKAFIQTELF